MAQATFEIIAFNILKHLNENDGAQDSIDGIIDWWLKLVDISYQTTKVNEVLDELVTKGVILRIESVGALTYKLNPSRRTEVSTLVKLLQRGTYG